MSPMRTNTYVDVSHCLLSLSPSGEANPGNPDSRIIPSPSSGNAELDEGSQKESQSRKRKEKTKRCCIV